MNIFTWAAVRSVLLASVCPAPVGARHKIRGSRANIRYHFALLNAALSYICTVQCIH